MPPLEKILEAVLLSAEKPLKIEELRLLFTEYERPSLIQINTALNTLKTSYQTQNSTLELIEVASGWRLQVAAIYSTWVSGLFSEKSPKYSRATLEILALIAYRQPITRGEIEEVRGVAVNSQIIKNLLERNWIKILGHKEVPGRPALFGTTKTFLDDFNLRTLSELPPLTEIESLNPQALQLGLNLNEISE